MHFIRLTKTGNTKKTCELTNTNNMLMDINNVKVSVSIKIWHILKPHASYNNSKPEIGTTPGSKISAMLMINFIK